MNAALEEAIKEAFAIAPVNKVVIHTLEIRQDGVQSPIYISQTRRGITALDENGIERGYIPCGFAFSLPPSNEDGFQSLNVAIDNIDLRVTDFVTMAISQMVPIRMVYRPYLSDDLTRPQMNPPIVLYLKEVELTTYQVVGRATFMDVVNKKFPSELYTRARFPALG